MSLSPRDQAILDFERSWWTEPGPKEVSVAQRFSLTMGEYQETLARLVDDPDAHEFDPLVIRRLRRQRDRRRQERTASMGGQR